MPIYHYENPKTGEVKEVAQGMLEEHSYSEDGVKWNRVFSSPRAAIDTEIDAFSRDDFISKTSNKKGTLGDLFDLSGEASEKRKNKIGVDPVKEKYYSDYSKERKGKIHPDKTLKEYVIDIK